MLDKSTVSVSKLDVFYKDRHVGTLAETPEKLTAFQYAPSWLNDGFSISPLSLPLRNDVFVANPEPLMGLFGVFDDSLPDGWGRLLVDRMLTSHGIDPYEVGALGRLAIVGSNGSGALEYRPAIDAPLESTIENLDEIAAECATVLASHESQNLDALFAMGGSSGGARPKVFYMIDGEEWIVKFPSSLDPEDIGQTEYELALAAAECGIEMPQVRLLPSQQCSGYFATKRFDRITTPDGAVRKIHMASAAALLETSHRIPNLDYDILMRLTLKLTGSTSEVEKMFRLMCFNVLCGNRDDHSKNFTFLYRESDGWALSPAYDLTQNPGMNGEHATTVNGRGRDIEDQDMLAVAERAGISKRKAKEMVERVKTALFRHEKTQYMRLLASGKVIS